MDAQKWTKIKVDCGGIQKCPFKPNSETKNPHVREDYKKGIARPPMDTILDNNRLYTFSTYENIRKRKQFKM